ncbi:MAG: serine/threonine protein kinase [Kiritimatiellae bacterium]|nr:serine/threonine protein kinase [Kiritimatiellia bacterium]
MSESPDLDGGLEAWLARTGATAEAAPPDRLWREGRKVGEWIVAGFVGRGGSAEVYCARHRRLGTAAVLKVLRKGGEGPRERFDRESRFLMESPGPAFPAFYGTGEEEGRAWVAMELLEEYPLPSTDAAVAAYLLDVARGTEELHRRGWVHRDLKPRNILRRASDGHAVLIDFGLLKRTGETAAAETAAGRVSPSVVDGREVGVGTPGYAAPEQFAGGAATPATDVHALGILADECFGGKPPRAWERIVRRATGSLPRQRYADAASFARAIRRRHWSRNAAWMALACTVVAALAAWGWATGRHPAPLPDSVPEPEALRPPSAPPVSLPGEERLQEALEAAVAHWEAKEEEEFRKDLKRRLEMW